MIAIGDWVYWHSKKKRRHMTGQVVDVRRRTAKIIWTTFDGQGHHWIEPIWKLRKISSLKGGDA